MAAFDIHCSAKCHNEAVELFPNIDSNHFERIHSRIVHKVIQWSIIQYFFDRSLVESKNAQFKNVCSACICWVSAKVAQTANSGRSSDFLQEETGLMDTEEDCASISADESAVDALSFLKEGESNIPGLPSLAQMDAVQLNLFSRSLGQTLSNKMKVSNELNNTTTRMHAMKTSTYTSLWEEEATNPLHSFLEGIVDVKNCSRSEKQRRIRYLMKCKDALYAAKFSKYISSLALAENISLYHYSGSKASCNLMGRISASGSYSTVLKAETEMGKASPVFPKGDIFVIYDNNQVIGRQFRVSLAGNIPQSTVTAITVTKDTNASNIQQLTKFPNVLREGNIKNLNPRYESFWSEAKQIHRQYRSQYIQKRLIHCINSSTYENGSLIDWIDQDDGATTTHGVGLEYERVPKDPSISEVFDQECMLLNPNSEENVEKVLNHVVMKNLESDPLRNWIVLVQDGLPYIIALKLIRSMRTCLLCQHNSKQTQSHMSECHAGRDVWSNSILKFQTLVLRPGNGHYEINLVRSIFANFFDIYISEIAKMLGFRTPRSLDYCKSAADHHKSWMILQIVYESLTDELLMVYLKDQECLSEIDTNKYMEWVSTKGMTNPNYALAFDFVFNVLHPLFLFRAAIRQCNDKVALAAREKVSVLFYGFNHPKYREINANDIFYNLSIPEHARVVIGKQSMRESFGAAGQGHDFIQEQRNAKTKMALPWEGIPTAKQWIRTSCALPQLDEIRKKTLERLQIEDDEQIRKSIDLSKEIQAARNIIRSWGKLQDFQETKLLTISPVRMEMNIQFSDFILHGENNRAKYYQHFLQDDYVHLYPANPFFGSPAARLKINDLVKIIRSKIKSMTEPHCSYFLKALKETTDYEKLMDLDLVVDDEMDSIQNLLLHAIN